MAVQLSEVERFGNDHEFREMKAKIQALVCSGDLHECGLDPSEHFRFIEVYKTSDGEIWRLAISDHAFRGYLRKDQVHLT